MESAVKSQLTPIYQDEIVHIIMETTFNSEQSQQSYAVKVVQEQPEHCYFMQFSQNLVNEYNIMSRLNHDYIVKVFDLYDSYPLPNSSPSSTCSSTSASTISSQNQDTVSYQQYGMAMKMELAYSNFQQFALKYNPRIPVLQKMFLQIASAISYIHSLGIAHNDIKPNNVLYFGNQTVKLTDFGYANYSASLRNPAMQYENWKNRALYYASPELIHLVQKKGTTKEVVDEYKSDSFAFGVLIFETIFNKLPYKDQIGRKKDKFFRLLDTPHQHEFWNQDELKTKLNTLQETERVSDQFIAQLKNLLQALFTFKVKQRLNFNQILQHTWFTTK